jgi:hypothetical protein
MATTNSITRLRVRVRFLGLRVSVGLKVEGTVAVPHLRFRLRTGLIVVRLALSCRRR